MQNRLQSDSQNISRYIIAERLVILYQHLLTSFSGAFACASIIAFTVYEVVDSKLVISWYIAIIITYLIRFGFLRWYRLEPQKVKLHMTLFTVGTLLTSSLWGVAGTLLMPHGFYLHQTIVIVVIAGITAGGLQALQANLTANFIYIFFSVLPLDIWLLVQQAYLYYILSLAMFIYIIFMLVTAGRGYKQVISSLNLRYENILINTKLEESNLQLKEEIIKQQKNAQSLAQLAAIVEFSKDAIVGLDIKGDIQSWNNGAEALYGYGREEVLGKSILFITSVNQRELIKSMMEKVLNNMSFNFESEHLHKDSHIIPISVTLSPVKNDQGNIIGISSMARDISKQKEMDKIKNEFVSIVSHELRTPLTSINGALKLLMSNVSKNSVAANMHLIEIAYHNCDRLIRLINDILDIEKIQSGGLELKYEKINMGKVISDAIEANKAYADKFQVQLQFVNQKDVWICGSYDRLKQVMTNFLSNAIKFSYANQLVEVGMEIKELLVKIYVTDHGQGIPVVFQDKIFEKFTQADASSTRARGGTGLGLSICKAIIEAHHSQIHFITKEGQGTTFYFELQLSKEKEACSDDVNRK